MKFWLTRSSSSTFDLAFRIYEDSDEDQEMILPHQFGLLMVDCWTNPRKAAEVYVLFFSFVAGVLTMDISSSVVDQSQTQQPHVNLAVDILVARF